MSNHASIHVDASSIADARFHCSHASGKVTFQLDGPGAWYVTGTEEELRAAAARLLLLADTIGDVPRAATPHHVKPGVRVER